MVDVDAENDDVLDCVSSSVKLLDGVTLNDCDGVAEIDSVPDIEGDAEVETELLCVTESLDVKEAEFD